MAVEGYILGLIGIAGTMLTILGAGLPLAKGVQAAAAAVAEKQRLNIFILIYLALAEAFAIYGLLIAFVMYTKIQPYLSGEIPKENFGVEYGLNGMFFIRGGYNSAFAKDSESGMSFGGGVDFGLSSSIGLALDYAYRDFGLLENVQMFTFTLSL